MRVSTVRTLHDGKIINGHTPILFESAGTGTFTLSSAKQNMAVAANQWCIFTTKRNLIYSAGKSQIVEETFDAFQPEASIIKRVGYFDSTTTSPYASSFDGFWLESSDNTIKIVVRHEDQGIIHESDITQWVGYNNLDIYQTPANWNGFTVILWDFLWLGGANLRMYIMTQNGWVLAHQFIHAGRKVADTMMKYPCKPLRYEIRSTGGTGNFRYICSQGATEGDISDNGYNRSIRAENVTVANIGTTYPILGIRKNMTYRCVPVSLENVEITPFSANDRGIFSLQINPTLSGPLAWTTLPNSSVQYSVGDGSVTVTSDGIELLTGTAVTNVLLPSGLLDTNFLSFLSQTLSGSADAYWLCFKPQTTSVSVNASMTYKEF